MIEEVIPVGTIRTHLIHAGSGKPLLLLHGLGGPQMWQRVVGPLSESFHVFAVDLPGLGESDCPTTPFSTGQYARFIATLLDALSLTTAHLAGISYGGQIAATLAAQSPHRIESLVLIASTGLHSPRWVVLNDVRWSVFSTLAKHVVLRRRAMLEFLSRRSFYDIRSRPRDLVETFRRQISQPGKQDGWLNCLRNVLAPSTDFREQLSAIRQSTLILWGAHDRALPVRVAEEFHLLIHGSRLEIVPESGHSLPLEKPDNVCEAIIRFLY